jgi:RNA polymerase sigma-70 factor (ECF subfamily)
MLNAPLAPESASADLELLQRIAARDETALAGLYDRHSRMVYGVALRILRSAPDAEDVVQDAFLRVWNRVETYDARLGSPGTWIVRIARNRAIDRLRAKRTRSGVSVEMPTRGDQDTNTLPEPETRETPEALLEHRSTARTVRAALSALPTAQRALIEAAFFEGFSHQELSARFGVPLGTVKTRIRTGLLALRGRLEHAV